MRTWNAARAPAVKRSSTVTSGSSNHALYRGAVLVVERAGRCVRNAILVEPSPTDFCGGGVGRLWVAGPRVKTGRRYHGRLTRHMLRATRVIVLLDSALREAGSIPPVQADAVPGRPGTMTNRKTMLGERQRGAILAEHEVVHREPECRELSELALARAG